MASVAPAIEADNELEMRFALLEEAIAIGNQKIANLEFQMRNLQGQVDRVTDNVAKVTPSFDEARRERRNRARYGGTGYNPNEGFTGVVVG
jgi:uncharacterized coiled-coil protein SlyX